MQFVKKSLLNKEILNDVNSIQNEIDQIDIPNDDFDQCEEYERLLNPNKDAFIKVSKKTEKKYKKTAEKMMADLEFKEKYQLYVKNRGKIEKYNKLKYQLDNNNLYIHNCIIKVLQFLKSHHYLDDDTNFENYDEITIDKVTTKGLIASQINECNEILFTELLINNYFDDLDTCDIATVLTVFLNTKINGRDDIASTSVSDVSYAVQDTIDH